MAGEYKAPCGCKIHVAQWTAKRKVVSQESCPLHLSAWALLDALKWAVGIIEDQISSTGPTHEQEQFRRVKELITAVQPKPDSQG